MMDRILHMIGLGRVTLVDDTKDVQRLQISQGSSGSDDGESLTDHVPLIGTFGLVSNPPENAEIALVRLGGLRSGTVAIGSNHRPSRPTGLKPGEVKLYDQHGAYVFLSVDGIVIDAAGKNVTVQNVDTLTVKATTKVRLETSKVETTGDFVSRCDGTSVSLNALKDAYAAHKHTGGTISGSTGLSDHPV